jgi:hypothetical protein
MRVSSRAGLARERYTAEILVSSHKYLESIYAATSMCRQRIGKLALEKATMSYV